MDIKPKLQPKHPYSLFRVRNTKTIKNPHLQLSKNPLCIVIKYLGILKVHIFYYLTKYLADIV